MVAKKRKSMSEQLIESKFMIKNLEKVLASERAQLDKHRQEILRLNGVMITLSKQIEEMSKPPLIASGTHCISPDFSLAGSVFFIPNPYKNQRRLWPFRKK